MFERWQRRLINCPSAKLCRLTFISVPHQLITITCVHRHDKGRVYGTYPLVTTFPLMV